MTLGFDFQYIWWDAKQNIECIWCSLGVCLRLSHSSHPLSLSFDISVIQHFHAWCSITLPNPSLVHSLGGEHMPNEIISMGCLLSIVAAQSKHSDKCQSKRNYLFSHCLSSNHSLNRWFIFFEMFLGSHSHSWKFRSINIISVMSSLDGASRKSGWMKSERFQSEITLSISKWHSNRRFKFKLSGWCISKVEISRKSWIRFWNCRIFGFNPKRKEKKKNPKTASHSNGKFLIEVILIKSNNAKEDNGKKAAK